MAELSSMASAHQLGQPGRPAERGIHNVQTGIERVVAVA